MSKPVCIKLLTGEEIFADVAVDKAALDNNLIKVYMPYIVEILQTHQHGTQFQLRPWAPFSDDIYYYIPANNVVNMSALDDQHTKMYGTAVLRSEVSFIQRNIVNMTKTNIMASDVFNLFKDSMISTVMDSSIRYGLPVPDKDDLEDAFYEFTMKQLNNTLEITQ